MKRIFFALAIVFAASLRAQAPEPMPLAHGNIPGEPHHHLKIENEYVRVYYVEVPPHENTQLHQHDHDYLFVTLGHSDVVNAVRDKPEVHLVLRDGETHFTLGGFAHVARNLAATPFRNITIELLKPQGEAHNECGAVIPGQGVAICDHFSADYSDTEFETTEIRLDRVQLVSGGKHKEDAAKFAFLVVGLGGPDVRISANGNLPRALRQGEIEWFEPGTNVEFSHEGLEFAQCMVLIFKDSKAHMKP
jgi:hypothetical protein